MESASYVLIFVLGASIGSFVNVLVYRLHNGESGILTGRSHCPHCKHSLNALDLIPLLSFLFLRRRCRYCRRKISWQYPSVELSGGLLFLIIAWQKPLDLQSTYFIFLFTAILLAISVYDLLYGEIPDEISFPAILLALLITIFPFNLSLSAALLGALIPLSFFALQFFISNGRFIGGGDLRLGALMGAILGVKLSIVALALSYFIGAFVSLPILLLQRKPGGTAIPFAPLLSLGTFLSMLWGQQILNWYLSLIL